MKDGNIAQVEFDEERHVYTYKGSVLHGVTGAISQTLDKTFPRGIATIEALASYGSQVHKEVERYFAEKVMPDTESAAFVVDCIRHEGEKYGLREVKCEMRVSDFEGTASNIDIALFADDGVHLYDIKTGAFDRHYCSLQLNAYRIMAEHCYGFKVVSMHVIATKSRRMFRIVSGYEKEVERILERNKGADND